MKNLAGIITPIDMCIIGMNRCLYKYAHVGILENKSFFEFFL